jgi:hypothetical protein
LIFHFVFSLTDWGNRNGNPFTKNLDVIDGSSRCSKQVKSQIPNLLNESDLIWSVIMAPTRYCCLAQNTSYKV